MKTSYYIGVTLCLVMCVIAATEASAAKNILFIFDASGSMLGKMPEGIKIDIARRALSARVENLPDSGINAGLVVYGHRRKGDCRDIQEVVTLQPLEKKELIAKVKSIQPKGQTPIAASIRLAADQLKELEETTTIILISDGKETCEADPCAAVQQLKDAGIDFVLHVIGFDVSAEERRQLECLAESGGGVYVPASTAEKLDEALQLLTDQVAESIAKVQENIEIILDTSATMRKPFEGGTKLEAAVKALTKVLDWQVAERDNLALRKFGGPCGEKEDNTKILVNFGQSNAEQIRTALAGLRSEGETTLTHAAKAAARDFDDKRRFEGVNKRVLIITGGQDSCTPQAASIISRELEKRKIRPDFYFIGMDVPGDQRRQLNEIQKATNGRISYVKNQHELENILEKLFEIEPVIADIKSVTNILGSIVEFMNKSATFLNRKSYIEAENEIRIGFKSLEETELPFRDLEKRLTREDFKKLYELIKTNRNLQEKILRNFENSIPLARSNQIDDYNKSIYKGNEMVSIYNSNIRKVEEILGRLPKL